MHHPWTARLITSKISILSAFVLLLFLSPAFSQITSTSTLLPGPKPADVPTEWKDFIGEYGLDEDIYIVLERDQKLMLVRKNGGEGTFQRHDRNDFVLSSSNSLSQPSALLQRNSQAIITLRLGDKQLSRRNLGIPAGRAPGKTETFRIEPVRPVDELRKEALAASPPEELGEFREPDLVELVSLDPAIHLDIRYATSNDFLGTPVYTEARAFMQRPAAEALLRVQLKLRPLGFGLLIHDAYRPWHVTKIFWDATPAKDKIFVADPSQGSRHNRGCAVDLTLYNLHTGKPVGMTGTYDEMSDRSYPYYVGGTSLQRWHRDLLFRRAMESEGFTVYEAEWWHFDYKDWHEYPILNIPFEKLELMPEMGKR